MLAIQKILFPTDYSPCAEQAFSQAAYLAACYEANLHVLHVTELPLAPPRLDITEADVAADLHLPCAEPSSVGAPEAGDVVNLEIPPLEGSVWRAILAYAREQDIDLIVMGTHGRSGAQQLLPGSVAAKVVRLATCPVFTVHQHAEPPSNKSNRRLLIPVDFSEHAHLAVAYARDLAAAYSAELDLLHVIAEPITPTFYGFDPIVAQLPSLKTQAQKHLTAMAHEHGRRGRAARKVGLSRNYA